MATTAVVYFFTNCNSFQVDFLHSFQVDFLHSNSIMHNMILLLLLICSFIIYSSTLQYQKQIFSIIEIWCNY